MEIELPDGTILDAPDGADPSAVAKAYLSKRNQPSDIGASTGKSRNQLQSEVDAYNQQESSLGGRLSRFALGPGADAMRQVGRLGKNVVQGAMSLPAAVADYPATVFNYGASKLGAEARIPEAFTNAVQSVGGQELAPANIGERIADRATQGASGALFGAALGGPLAATSSPVASRVGLAMMERPFTQAVAGTTGGASAQIAKESGAGPVGQLAAGMVGGMAGALATGPIKQPMLASRDELSKEAQVAAARDAGYKLTPRQGGGKVGAVAEGLSNSAKMERIISRKNQANTNRLVREELGIGGKGPVSPKTLDGLRSKYNGAYSAVAKTGKIQADQEFARDMFSVGDRTAQLMRDFPDAASPAIEKLRNSYLSAEFDASSAVESVRRLRADAGRYLKSFDDPEKVALGMASRQIADALDKQLQRHVESIGQGGLAAAYRSARTQLAKIHSVEDALNESSGNVSAVQLGRMLDRGAPLSGNLKKIAETARTFPKAVQNIEAMPNAGFEFVDPALGGMAGGAAYAIGSNPAVGIPIMLARPAARQAFASDVYQNFLGPAGPAHRNMLLRSGLTGAASSPELKRE